MADPDRSNEEGSLLGLFGYLACLLGGVALLGCLFATESLDLLRNSEMLDLIGVSVPAYAGLFFFGAYGLLGRFLRSRARSTSNTERALMVVGLRHTPWGLWLAFALLLLPLAIGPIRRAPSVASLARRATSFWVLPALLFAAFYGWDAYHHYARSADRRAVRALYREAEAHHPVDCERCRRAERLAAEFRDSWGEAPRGLGTGPISCQRCASASDRSVRGPHGASGGDGDGQEESR
ncbi:MAG TPA: hypothetical protein RMH99_27390 [Sandaracinaceae bacterium LLY-WYZ-13_1]|nr:hypothetical protein [Sandaracinaceae bacterium LLY-WYZ-13_1]